MALATQCPHCHTTFRVAHDQLKLRAGIVRCGQCRQVFNGIEHLLPSAGMPQSAHPGAAPETGSDDVGGLILPGAMYQPASSPLQPAGDDADAGLEAGTEPDTSSPAAAVQPKAAAAQEDELEELDYGALEGMTLIHFPQEEQPAQQDEPQPAADTDTDTDTAASAQPKGEDTDPTESAAARTEDRSPDAASQTAAPSSEHNAHEPRFVTDARRQQHKERGVRLLYGAGCAILALVMLAQASYALRNQIAAQLPQAKPALLAICRALGCSITLPAQIDAITIESSELQAQPGAAGNLVLTLLLRNRSSTAQAWPNIELSLNDGNERAILRRVFTPREFPIPAAGIAKGFGADSEQSIRLSFHLSQLRAAGYRVVLFYP